MADIALTAAQIGVAFPEKAEIYDFIAAATITAGQVVYLTSAGKVDLADANGSSATLQVRGIALTGAGAGQGLSVLKRGHCYGFTLSQAYDAALFLSNTAGAMADSAGGTSVNVGRVVALPDNSLTKVAYIDADWLRTWA